MKELQERTTVTILSVLLLAGISKMIDIGNLDLFYASITAVIITHVDFHTLIQNAKNRAIGTIVGGIVGIAFSYIMIPFVFKLIIGELITILTCEKIIKIPSAIGSVVFLIIVYEISDIPPYIYGIRRVLDTFLGIGITVVVTYMIKKIGNR